MSTFKGPLNVKGAINHKSVADGTGTVTLTTIVDSSGNLVGSLIGTDELTTGAGTGITAVTTATYSTNIIQVGDEITTTITVDLTGLAVSTTDLDIIGKGSGTANCHFGKIAWSDCGYIYAGSMACLEAPLTGDTDIDLYCATEATGAENAAITGLAETALVTSGAAWTLGRTKVFSAIPPLNNQYLYLTAGGGGSPETYTAGIFKIVLKSTAIA